MKRVASVTSLKASLSAFLARVKTGEEILVTERGKPIARVVPYRAAHGTDDDLARLVREGVLRAGDGTSTKAFLVNRPRACSRSSIVQALLEERAAGR